MLRISEAAKLSVPSSQRSQYRNFGSNKEHAGGHQVTYINPAALQASELVEDGAVFVDELRSLARRADTLHGVPVVRLALRCLEVIQYKASDSHSLGFHDDGTTVLTMAIPLSVRGSDFEGGTFEAKRGQCREEANSTLGDVLAWRGWDDHRVTPVSSGQREVLVAEWWLDNCTDAYSRPGDTLASLLAVLEVPSASLSANLQHAAALHYSAEVGRADSQHSLAAMCSNGSDGAKPSDKIAADWFRKAAEQGHAESQYNLGTLCSAGRGVQRSDKAAVKWFRKAAKQGHAGAQNMLGKHYMEGRGVTASRETALKWWRKAAAQDYAKAHLPRHMGSRLVFTR